MDENKTDRSITFKFLDDHFEVNGEVSVMALDQIMIFCIEEIVKYGVKAGQGKNIVGGLFARLLNVIGRVVEEEMPDEELN